MGTQNTGKSTLVNIIKKWFHPSQMGVISANFEKQFGIDGIIDKELIVIPDMPHNIAQFMDATLLQSIIY